MEMLQFDFMRRAFLAAFMISLIAPILGLQLILRRQSLVADTLSHVSLVGVALGFLLGINPTFTTFLVVSLVAILLEYLRSVYSDYNEVSLAFIMSGGMALAFLMMSLTQGSLDGSVNQYLFGSIVTVTADQLILLAVIVAVILVVSLLLHRVMYVLMFDEETAQTMGVPVKTMSFLFTLVVGFVIALIMPIVGSLLISAILIFPAAIAMRWGKSFRSVTLLGILIAMIGMFSGLVISYYYSTPPGATIVVIYILIFVASTVIRQSSVLFKK